MPPLPPGAPGGDPPGGPPGKWEEPGKHVGQPPDLAEDDDDDEEEGEEDGTIFVEIKPQHVRITFIKNPYRCIYVTSGQHVIHSQ